MAAVSAVDIPGVISMVFHVVINTFPRVLYSYCLSMGGKVSFRVFRRFLTWLKGCFVENFGIVVVGFCGHRNVLFMGWGCDYSAFYICNACFSYMWIMLSGCIICAFKSLFWAFSGHLWMIWG